MVTADWDQGLLLTPCSEEPTDQHQAAAAAFYFIAFLLKFFGEEGGPSDINTVEYIQILPRGCSRQEALNLPCITWEFLACFSASFLICHWGMGWLLLQASPEMFLHGRWAGLNLFSAVALFWRSLFWRSVQVSISCLCIKWCGFVLQKSRNRVL